MPFLHEQLAGVVSAEELWALVTDRLNMPMKSRHVSQHRFSPVEATAFVAAGERVGLDSQVLATEYWNRANKAGFADALAQTKSERRGGFDSIQIGWDLKHAVDYQIGWLRIAGVPVPLAVLEELSEHAHALAALAKANRSHVQDYLPSIEQVGPVLNAAELREVRLAAAEGIFDHAQSVGFRMISERVGELADALNNIERYGLSDGDKLGKALYWMSPYFRNPSYAALFDRRGAPVLPEFFGRWDWSAHTEQVYGKFLVATSDPEFKGRPRGRAIESLIDLIDNADTSSQNRHPVGIFDQSYAALALHHAPSPGMARALRKRLDDLVEAFGDSGSSSMRELLGRVAEADKSHAAESVEHALAYELKHDGLTRTLMTPQHMGVVLDLYEHFGGGLERGPLREGIQGYLVDKLVNGHVDSFLVGLASRLGLGPDKKPDMYQGVVRLIAAKAQRIVQIGPLLVDSHVIADDKKSLSQIAGQLANLAVHLNSPCILHEQLGLAANAAFRTKFGYGLHYLSELAIAYESTVGVSPLEIISSHVDTEQLKALFMYEKDQTRKARIDGQERIHILNLYDSAHTVLFGGPVPRQAKSTGAKTPQQQQRSQPQVSNDVTIYIGSRKVNGADRQTVDGIRAGLEGKVNGELHLNRSSVPGKGELYGIAMSPSDFVTALNDSSLSSAVQAVYFSGAIMPQNIDTTKFRMVRDGSGVFIQTTPTPNTFAIHHIKSLAEAATSKAYQQR